MLQIVLQYTLLRMKQLNENWFSITLTEVVFGILGFLLGKKQNINQNIPQAIHMKKMNSNKKMIWVGEEGNIQIDFDTINENGEKKVKVMVIKKD